MTYCRPDGRVLVGHRRALHDLVWARDHGVCALCSADCVALLHAYCRALTEATGTWGVRDVVDRAKALGFDPKRPWWEADHVVPLSEGGADEPLNVQTLCQPCHRTRTAELRGRLAKRTLRRARQLRNGWCAGSGRRPRLRRAGLERVQTCPRCGAMPIALWRGKVGRHRRVDRDEGDPSRAGRADAGELAQAAGPAQDLPAVGEHGAEEQAAGAVEGAHDLDW